MINADDLPLFAARYPHFPGAQRRDTSEEAAALIKPKVGRLQQMVLDYIREHGGATDFEIERDLKLGPNTARPRRVELYLAGKVIDSGLRRPTASGRQAAVWVVAP